MKAMLYHDGAGPQSLHLAEVPTPTISTDEVLIKVAATAVNRADILQTKGLYPPPAGASEILGLECSGTIEQVGENVSGIQIGDEVCALIAGGGYAEYVAVPKGQVLPVPENTSLQDAAALPEACATVWSNLVMTAHLQAGELVLIHGGAGGIGSMAIQVAKTLGAQVAVTAGSDEKLQYCKDLGADILINYKEEDFVEVMSTIGGANVILDVMGAKYLDRNINALGTNGRLVIIGMQGGIKAELNIAKLLTKRGTIHATNLRGRTATGPGSKEEICQELFQHIWPMVADSQVLAQVHSRNLLTEAPRILDDIERYNHRGKQTLHLSLKS